MKTALSNSILAALLSLAALPSTYTLAAPAPAPSNFADLAFQRTWERTDALVDSGKVKRSWYWGPTAGYTTMEEYDQGFGGMHLVQYFDKSRMEINDPGADKNKPFYVTNGHLARELITGMIQVGDNRFVERYPADIPLASDLDDLNAPTYITFREDIVCCAEPNRVGEQARYIINKSGRKDIDFNSTLFLSYHVTFAHYEKVTERNIPGVFWDFLNSTGPVLVDGKQQTARLSDPYFYATGYPISGAYWSKVKIAGKENTDVLIQVFERRVLTYVPSAPDSFKVQMGNIGQHYFQWRYGTAGQPPAVAGKCPTPPWHRLGKLWQENAQLRRYLGCPGGDSSGGDVEYTGKVAQQSFERGQMLDVIEQGKDGTTHKWLYVLYEDGTAQRVDDFYKDGTPEPTPPPPPPPPGLQAPVRGFGKVWREQRNVRNRLGWATNPEVVANDGAFMYHQHGIPVYAGAPLNKIYVLYVSKDGVASLFDIKRWEMYPAPMH
jgi:hypothetical protein